MGSGRLQVRCDQVWTDLLRYSNSLAQRFHKVSRQLDAAARADLVDRDRILVAEVTKLDPPVCPKCSLRLPLSADPHGASCPRCMQRGQIVRRVVEWLAPDRILVFDNGDLVEQGSHAALIQQDGQYARMVRIQMRVSKDPSVDKLLGSEDVPLREDSSLTDQLAATTVTTEADASQISWLQPDCIQFTVDSRQRISLPIDGGIQTLAYSVFALSQLDFQTALSVFGNGIHSTLMGHDRLETGANC